MKEWEETVKFNDKYFPNWRKNKELIFFSNAIAGETGELCNLVKKAYGGGTNRRSVSKEDLAFECVDIFIYTILLLESMGLNYESFSEIFDFKLKILRRRMEDK